jgi:Ni/Co efflux regulator RcnB
MNKKILTAALAAVIAGSSIGIASAADAQSYGQSYGRPRRRLTPMPPHASPRTPSPPVRPRRWSARRPAPSPTVAGRPRNAAIRAPRYVAPRGYQTRAWAYGQRLPAQYRTRSYVVTDYGRYGLRRPPSGYQYVRSGNDVVLTAVTTGLITAVIAGLFN